MKPKLATKSIVNHFGGATQLSRLISKNFLNRESNRTVESWIYRDSIPAKKLMDLVELGDRIGKPLVLDQHIQK
jgi:hypothetical protein